MMFTVRLIMNNFKYRYTASTTYRTLARYRPVQYEKPSLQKQVLS